MTSSPQWFIVRLVSFPYDVMVSIDEECDVLINRLVKRFGQKKKHCKPLRWEKSKVRLGRFYMLPTNVSVIRITRQEKLTDTFGYVVHESFHAVHAIMEKMDVKLQMFVSDEVFAYQLEYLTKEIFKRMKL